MKKKGQLWPVYLFGIICIVILFELIRTTLLKQGDFKGYLLVGDLAMAGENIYEPKLNTWPPFFSIASVPLSIIRNMISIYGIHFIWLSGLIFSMYKTIGYTTKMTLGRTLVLRPLNLDFDTSNKDISITHALVLIPLLIVLRYILENMLNIQINIFLLLMAMYSLYLFEQKKYGLAGLILGFSIALKVITVFLLLYFLVKREFKLVSYTLITVIVCWLTPFLVFGVDTASDYYNHWYSDQLVPFAHVAHKNQSYFGLVRALLTHESPGLKGTLKEAIYINFADLSIEWVKIIAYSLVAVAGSGVVYLFRRKLENTVTLKRFIEYSLLLTIIPMLSPISWKAYYIFLWSAYFLNYLFLFRLENNLPTTRVNFLKLNYYISILLVIFSSEIFLGKRLSDVMETYYCIVWGSILLAVNLILIYTSFDKFNTQSSKHLASEKEG